jgi:riboflavin kinase / FMN adenylyltransferase
MEVVGPGECVPTPSGAAVTVGAYDGVHLGHRHVLGDLRRLAEADGLETVVVTFDRHPATVVRPESAPHTLTDLEQKLELLADCGVDRTVVIPFDRARSDESAEDFVQSILVDALAARLVVVGRDFHFGHDRKGDVALLSEMGRSNGFDVRPVELVSDAEGEPPVSSTRIRRLIAEGAVKDAARLLGRAHQVRGPVKHGAGRGARLLGFPTANVGVAREIALPAPGVYAGRFTWRGATEHPSAISVGQPPTFQDVDDGSPLVEAYLLDFEGDLYDEPARISFEAWIRPQRAFDDLDALKAQMSEDVDAARRVLAG